MNYIEKQLPFSNRKRVEFISSNIIRHISNNQYKKYSMLDIGCGTGELFSIPLSLRLQKFQNINILGIDIDRPSINRANKHINKLNLANIRFAYKPIEKINKKYNCICLMAVLEHLKNPDKMLMEIRKKLRSDGNFILYIPNGYGDYEIESAILKKIKKSKFNGILKFSYNTIRKLKHRLIKKQKNKKPGSFIIKETLNDPHNVHIQFFKLKDIKYKLNQRGYIIKKIYKTHFLNGPISNRILLRSDFLKNIDNKIASIVPDCMASDWTFMCTFKG